MLRAAFARAAAAAAARALPARGMATLKEVSNRIQSVKNIAKITKTMKMVAAAKMKAAERSLRRTRAYVAGLDAVMNAFDAAVAAKKDAGAAKDAAAAAADRKEVVLAFSADRGLCGGVNSSIAKSVRAMLRTPALANAELFLVGDKANVQIGREFAKRVNTAFHETTKATLTFATASAITQRVLASNYGRVTLVFNKFRNSISFDTTRRPLLSTAEMNKAQVEFGKFEFEIDQTSDFYEFFLANAVWYAMNESFTVEQSARMMAMDSSNRNANDMIGKLTLFYNRTRQAVITRELIEIISGASAL